MKKTLQGCSYIHLLNLFALQYAITEEIEGMTSASSRQTIIQELEKLNTANFQFAKIEPLAKFFLLSS